MLLNNSYVHTQFIFSWEQFICSRTIHMFMKNSYVHEEFICSWRFHMFMNDAYVREQFTCAWTIHKFMNKLYVHIEKFICSWWKISYLHAEQFICSCRTIHISMKNSNVNEQFKCSWPTHMYMINLYVHEQFIFSLWKIHMFITNNSYFHQQFVHEQFKCSWTIYLLMNNLYVHEQFISAWTIQLLWTIYILTLNTYMGGGASYLFYPTPKRFREKSQILWLFTTNL